MTSLATTQLGEDLHLIPGGVLVARGMLDREDLLQRLDRAVTRRVTVVSAPPGSGKTSLLRAWSGRPSKDHLVAFVSVCATAGCPAILARGAGRHPQSAGALDSRTRTAFPGLDGDAMVDAIVSELAEQSKVGRVDHRRPPRAQLSSAAALTQLERLCVTLPSSARLVLSSRRDPPIRLHRLRFADEVAEIRAGDLRFTERETRELLAASGIRLSDAGAAALYQRTEGWAAGLRLAVISLTAHPDPERFVDRPRTDRTAPSPGDPEIAWPGATLVISR
jgi:LuxR family maltose regulon positive regulatory protein